MSEQAYPLLEALRARGSAAYTGEPLSYLLVEVRGERLLLTGATPLRFPRDGPIRTGAEYRYILEAGQAEKLLAALSRASGDRPEQRIAREFELSWPERPLKDYLDGLGLTYQYEYTEGESL